MDEDRPKDRELLACWAKGEGTPYQKRLGILAAQYDVLKGYGSAPEPAQDGRKASQRVVRG